MATAPAVSTSIWHSRGTWNPREDRVSFAVLLGILWIGMIAGFGVDFPRYLHEKPPAPAATYVHGAVFTGWMLILTAQVLLVLNNRVGWHRKFGWFAAGWACLMAVMGPWAAVASYVVNLHLPTGDPPFLSVNIVDIGGFVALLAWAIALRRNPAAHKRLMILATVSLADPGFARFSGWLRPAAPAPIALAFLLVFYGNVVLVALMLGWDWWRGRLMPQIVAAAVGLLGAEIAATLLYFWAPWRTLTLHWVETWAKLTA